jgi:hypothetical protein
MVAVPRAPLREPTSGDTWWLDALYLAVLLARTSIGDLNTSASKRYVKNASTFVKICRGRTPRSSSRERSKDG